MQPIETRKFLTHKAVLAMLTAATERAEAMGQPQCIVIVDTSGGTLGELKMTGAKFLSLKSARAKALTAASTGRPSSAIPEAVRSAIGAATGGSITGLPGGLPIVVDGELLGGIGIGSGTGDQDVEVANAALASIGASQ
ncbi:GlcG/HbpS family heme-binding protein [Hoeflea alexandrii]|uniref:GlcG/HbpS family heme-binding protein n=1 Tax=Hoeflea alexandrii TaxID=288436 RepID=UPI0022AE9525|nr:heme-binding protein [Hoeflea alexandrii]MCZ4292157.1 heme-binding protein [Hoeflea alexandrii]